MVQYRCYFFDESEHVVQTETESHTDDIAAQEWFDALRLQQHAAELWIGSRLVGRRERK